ncbi:hypothetical protein HW450_10395 [Corynebacterium hindlerae]|uniref:Uncharacterized protein n=1 Tax=Corynebacterium hindlerae TaxID=699041 RepID=A0A7G5FDQ1_9CORY|nr:hypothetical protein [Corynebacterium hindlerae]QMV84742.1 hypothetical protein HW450_10395 [Corynebacterium hindlerae]
MKFTETQISDIIQFLEMHAEGYFLTDAAREGNAIIEAAGALYTHYLGDQ